MVDKTRISENAKGASRPVEMQKMPKVQMHSNSLPYHFMHACSLFFTLPQKHILPPPRLWQTSMKHLSTPQAVSALDTPSIPIPKNAPTIHNPRLCVRSKLSLNNCSATLAMIPAVTANIPP